MQLDDIILILNSVKSKSLMDIRKKMPVVIKAVRSKYFIAAFVFVVWVSLFDENNLIERYRLIQELNQIEKDKLYYHQRIQEDAARLKELQTNDENLEKFAREQYLMRKEDEDVFIIVKEK